ncbi:MAG TPA: DASH family cryptochrome, partial [Sphingobacteriaceae bacterium]|nr:DASH family cryptochrome [Sphingobacteriaceae bacterium]
MNGKTILVWFRNDLRIHDNEILFEAIRRADKIVPVYCFDPDHFGISSLNTQKTGAIRAKFIIESVANLKKSLQKLGADLIVKFGKPEDILPEIVQQYAVAEVYHHREVASEETETSAKVEAALWKLQINLRHFIRHTMYHKEDLPFPIKDIPDVFSIFRKKIERESTVRQCLATPEAITVPAGMETGAIPTLADLGLEEQEYDERSVLHFKGGETEGLKRLAEYIRDFNLSVNSKDLRSQAPGAYSSKLSPWIALGCISTRKVYWEIKNNEHLIAKETLNRMMLELLRRDYFRFMLKKHSNKFSQAKERAEQRSGAEENDEDLFLSWKNAGTGVPFIDAIMNELNATGYISNSGRQNIANFLIKNLRVNWVRGAAYFKEKLIDYSPASNLGNWIYIVEETGKSPADNKNSAILKLANESDPKGDYVRKWLPMLASIPGSLIHEPWKLSPDELKAYGIQEHTF